MKDDEGSPLYVGDLVECTYCGYPEKSTFRNFVCHDEEDGDFILGIATSSSSITNRGRVHNWKVKKVKDYTALVAGSRECQGGTTVAIEKL